MFLKLKIKKKTFRWAKINYRKSIYFYALLYINRLLKIPLKVK